MRGSPLRWARTGGGPRACAAKLIGMQHDWLLLETLGSEPAVVSEGATPKELIPISGFLRRSPHLTAIQTAVSETVETGAPLASLTLKQKQVIRTEPVTMTDGRVHGVHLWVGPTDQEPPQRPMPGPITWNLTTGEATDSPQGLLNRGEDPENASVHGRSFADDLPAGTLRSGEAKLLALALAREPGETICETWDIVGGNGDPMTTSFVARVMVEEADDGSEQVMLRGMNWRSEPEVAAVEPDSLAQRLLAGLAMPDTYRSLVDLKSWTLLKWLDAPSSHYNWRRDTVHPDDLAKLINTPAEFESGGTTLIARMSHDEDAWVPVHITINRIELEPGLFVGLLAMRRATDAETAEADLG